MYREREGEMYVYVCMYIYIYIYIYTFLFYIRPLLQAELVPPQVLQVEALEVPEGALELLDAYK